MKYQYLLIQSVFHHFDKLFEIDFSRSITRLFDHFLYFFLIEPHVELITNSLQLRQINIASLTDVNELKSHLHFFLKIGIHKFPTLWWAGTFWTGIRTRRILCCRFRPDRLLPTSPAFPNWMVFTPSAWRSAARAHPCPKNRSGPCQSSQRGTSAPGVVPMKSTFLFIFDFKLFYFLNFELSDWNFNY